MADEEVSTSKVETKRKNFHFTNEDLRILERITSRTQQNETAAVKRAQRVLDLIIEETRNGSTIEIYSKGKRVKQLVLL